MDPRLDLAQSLAADYGRHPQVEAVAIGGSLAAGMPDERSDIDLYVYLTQALSLEARGAIARARADQVEVGNDYWEPGDEWIERRDGVHVDVIYRDTRWTEDQLDRVLRRHQASVGYSTCIWHNLRSAGILMDRHDWLRGVQREADAPYPEELVAAIVAKNHPILRETASAYSAQLRSALARNDWVSVNHRVAAVLASYFDILFAVNRTLHPGEKRLLEQADRLCARRPPRMIEQVHALLASAASGDGLLPALDGLVDDLDHLMQQLRRG
jgi:predicted nucleotidyltransferase